MPKVLTPAPVGKRRILTGGRPARDPSDLPPHGAMLRRARMRQGKTLFAIAKLSGVPWARIANAESGRANEEVFQRVAIALGLDPSEVLRARALAAKP